MCSKCGKIMSPLFGTNLQNLYDQAEKGDSATKSGRYPAILEGLQKNGGCSSCINLIKGKA